MYPHAIQNVDEFVYTSDRFGESTVKSFVWYALYSFSGCFAKDLYFNKSY